MLAYSPALRGDFLWDDDAHVSQNTTLRTAQGLQDIWFHPGTVQQYYPVFYTVLWVEYHLWQAHPLGYHLVNIVLHAVNAILFAMLLLSLGVPGAWLGGLFFALHPLQVESVAWISELKNVLSAFFYLLAAHCYFSTDRTRNRIAIVFYTAAVLSKSVAFSLPFAIPLIFWAKRERFRTSDFHRLIPFFFIGGCIGGYTVWFEKNLIGARGPEWSLTFAERSLIAGRAVWFYLGKFVWPHPLMFIYPRWTIAPYAAVPWLYPLGVLLLLAALWFLRSFIGRMPLAAMLFFIGTLAPALGFLNVYPMRFTFVADHFTYLANMGLMALFSAVLLYAMERFRLNKLGVRIALTLLLCVNLTLAVYNETQKYRSPEMLWTDTLRKNPACALAHQNLGIILYSQGRLAEALAHFQMATQLNPYLTQSHLSLAYMLTRLGRRDEALEQYRQVIELGVTDPDILSDYKRLLRR